MHEQTVDLKKIRADFPIFSGDNAPVYLDSAATSQKPYQVIDRVSKFLGHENANVHRGVYRLSEAATESFEGARIRVQKF
jgi:selenocysteine lyase/cysteine desulfurase